MSDKPSFAKKSQLNWLIWGFMVLSLGAYFAVAMLLSDPEEPPSAENLELAETLLPIFIGLSVLEVVIALAMRHFMFFKRYAARKFGDLSEVSEGYFTTCMVTWALMEAVAIYGFILSILSGELIYYVAFMIPALLLLLFFHPKLTKIIEDYEVPGEDLPTDDLRTDDPPSTTGGPSW